MDNINQQNQNNGGNSEELFDLIQSLQSKLSIDKGEKNNNVNQSFGGTEPVFNDEKNEESFSNGPNIDLNAIMNIQRIVSSMNRDDPRKNLLISLKPFLRKSRQDKINEYITILSLTRALGLFGEKGSD